MTIYLVVDNPPPDWGNFEIMSNGFTKLKDAKDKMNKLRIKIGMYETQYFEIGKIKVVK